MATKTATMKERLEYGVLGAIDGTQPNGKKSNVSKTFYEIFAWQEINKLAGDKLKQAWAKAQVEDGPIPTDDAMRARGEGEHIVAETTLFSCVAKVTAPRKVFDVDTFIEQAAKRWKIPVTKVAELVEACKVPGKAALTKRVLEVE